jgi:glycosyltransferase involved in cell wall biosynthesis
MLIGLVLASFPGYSETFIRNKIKLLSQSGKRVIVFANGSVGEGVEYEFVEGFTWKSRTIDKANAVCIASTRLLLSPLRSLKLFLLNKRDGYTNKENLLSLFSSAHILRFNLDWLHFGFATNALGKENLSTVLGARMAASIRGFDIAVYPLNRTQCYKLLWERIDKLHYISDDLLNRALESGFNSQTIHKKITPAIDTDLFAQPVRQNSQGKPHILTIARLHWIKGIEYVLQALHLVRENGVDFIYTIVGDGPEYERLVFAAHQLGISDNVRFVGKQTPDNTKQFLYESNIYIQYSLHEGFCNAVIEAQAAGLLTIVSDAGALPENVINNKTGWIVPKRKPQALADQILIVAALSARERERVSFDAHTRAVTEFGIAQQQTKFLDFYR